MENMRKSTEEGLSAETVESYVRSLQQPNLLDLVVVPTSLDIDKEEFEDLRPSKRNLIYHEHKPMLEITALKTVVKFVEEYKLGSAYHCENLWNCIEQLEKQKAEKKRGAAADSSRGRLHLLNLQQQATPETSSSSLAAPKRPQQAPRPSRASHKGVPSVKVCPGKFAGEPAQGTPVPMKGFVMCKFPNDPTVALGCSSVLALAISAALNFCS